MTDEALRALARRFQRTRAPEDEAAWLGHMVRVGGLDAARVELAAAFDHAPAVAAVGESGDLLGRDALRRLLRALDAAVEVGVGRRACLVLESSAGERVDVMTPCAPVTIGRDPSSTLRLGGLAALSRRHARIRFFPGFGFVVDDVGSRSGTYLNGRVVRSALLDMTDVLTFGEGRVDVAAMGGLGPPEEVALARRRVDVLSRAPDRPPGPDEIHLAERWAMSLQGAAPALLRSLLEWARVLPSHVPDAEARDLDLSQVLSFVAQVGVAPFRAALVDWILAPSSDAPGPPPAAPPPVPVPFRPEGFFEDEWEARPPRPPQPDVDPVLWTRSGSSGGHALGFPAHVRRLEVRRRHPVRELPAGRWRPVLVNARTLVLEGGAAGQVAFVDLFDGRLTWTSPAPARFVGQCDAGLVLVEDDATTLVRRNRAGAELGRLQLPGRCGGGALAGGRTAVLRVGRPAGPGGLLVGVDVREGPRWTREVVAASGPVLVAGGVVFEHAPGPRLEGIDAADGTTRWTTASDALQISPMAGRLTMLAGREALLARSCEQARGPATERLIAIDAATGAERRLTAPAHDALFTARAGMTYEYDELRGTDLHGDTLALVRWDAGRSEYALLRVDLADLAVLEPGAGAPGFDARARWRQRLFAPGGVAIAGDEVLVAWADARHLVLRRRDIATGAARGDLCTWEHGLDGAVFPIVCPADGHVVVISAARGGQALSITRIEAARATGAPDPRG